MFGSRDDRAKVHEKAHRLALKGELGKAISTLKHHLASHPDDDRTLLKLADLHRRDGDDAAAVAAFSAATRLYMARGFSLKAAASLRQAVALAPSDPALLEQLAEVNAGLGLARDAARALEEVAAAVAQTGDRARLVALRRRILSLLPGDAGAVIRLADLLAEGGQRAEAVALLEDAAGARSEPAQAELWTLLQERLCALQPEDADRARALARALLARGSPKRALAQLKPCYGTDRSNVETLSLLAQAFAALGQVTKAATAWRELAHAHQRAGRAAELRAAWQKVRELIPGDAEAATALTPPPLPPRDLGATLAQELAEADFLAEQGAEAEARAILLRLRERLPDSVAVAQRLEALDVELVDPEELIAEEELVRDDEEPRDSTTTILERVPPDRIPRVAEGALHRDLAIAFLEMELFDQALAELDKAAADDPPRESACLALAGRCHLARGAPRDAVDAYRRALAATTLSFEAATAVHYELAEALEALGETEDALAHFRAVERLDPGFRDVRGRIGGRSTS